MKRNGTVSIEEQFARWRKAEKNLVILWNQPSELLLRCSLLFNERDVAELSKYFRYIKDIYHASFDQLELVNPKLIEALGLIGIVPNPTREETRPRWEAQWQAVAKSNLTTRRALYERYLESRLKVSHTDNAFQRYGQTLYVYNPIIGFLKSASVFDIEALDFLTELVSVRLIVSEAEISMQDQEMLSCLCHKARFMTRTEAEALKKRLRQNRKKLN